MCSMPGKVSDQKAHAKRSLAVTAKVDLAKRFAVLN
jgi:hypothetical protein